MKSLKSCRRLDFCIDFTIQSMIDFECVALILAVLLLCLAIDYMVIVLNSCRVYQLCMISLIGTPQSSGFNACWSVSFSAPSRMIERNK